MIPVITHPERNRLLRQRIEDISQWVEAGARVQITAQSVTGEFGSARRSSAKRCWVAGWRTWWRATRTIASIGRRGWIWLALSGEAIRRGGRGGPCVANPRAMVEGQPVEVVETEVVEPRRWYQFWR